MAQFTRTFRISFAACLQTSWLSSSPYRDTAPFSAQSPLRTYPRSDAAQAPYDQDMTTLSRRVHTRRCQPEEMPCISRKSCGVTLGHTTLMQHAGKSSPWLTIARSRHGWSWKETSLSSDRRHRTICQAGTGPTARYHPTVTLPLSIISNLSLTSFAANHPARISPMLKSGIKCRHQGQARYDMCTVGVSR